MHRFPRKGFIGIISVFMLISLVLAACGSKTNSEHQAGDTNQSKEIDWKTVKANIRFVYPGTSEAEKQLAENFQAKMKEKYPNVNIEFMYLSWQDMDKKLGVMINSGDWPDMTMTQDITNLVQLNGLEDLTPYLERAGATINKDSFLPGTLEYSTVGGKIYSVPTLANSFSLMVNEKMLNEAGMQLEDLKTWADVEKAAKLMTKNGKYGFGYPLGVARFAFRVPFTAGYSNDLVLNDTSDASKKKYIETLQHFKNLQPYMPQADITWGYPEMFRAFSNGEVGMIAAGTFFSANVYSINPDIMKVARAIPYPVGPSGTKAKAPVSSVGIGMFSGSKNKDLVWRLIQEWTAQEFNSTQAAAVNVSALKDSSLDEIMKKAQDFYPKALDGHKRLLQDFSNMLKNNGVPMAIIPGQSEMETVVQDQMAKMLTNKATPEQAYEGIKDGIDKIKAKFK
jgi:multiple sugar transport system substrate-binding protein